MSGFQAFPSGQGQLSALLKLNPIQISQRTSTTSLVKDKGVGDASIVNVAPAMMNPFEAMNYLRPSNQLILLLQKGVDFPVFPPELSECVSRPSWQLSLPTVAALTRCMTILLPDR